MAEDRFIDVHWHMYPDARLGLQAQGGTSRSGFTGTPEEAVPFMKETGIRASVMVNFTPVFDMVAAARARLPEGLSGAALAEAEEEIRVRMANRVRDRNKWSCGVTAEHPELISFIGLDPVLPAGEMEAEVENCYAAGARGIKLHPVFQHIRLDDERWRPGLAAAERLGMVVLTHMGPLGNISGDYATVAQADDVLTRFPRLPMILAHSGGPEKDAAVALAQRWPHIVFDCTGMPDLTRIERTDEELVALFRRFGQGRVAFGSDWCFNDPRPDVARLRQLPMRPEEIRGILHDTAARVLGLE